MRELSDSDESLRQRADMVYRLLGEVYGIKPWKPRREPLHELISTILSHRTTQANEAKAFDRLWQKYGSWEAICDCAGRRDRRGDRARQLARGQGAADQGGAGSDRRRARRRRRSIFWPICRPSRGWPGWKSLPGVGPKTASLVLLFCFHKPVLPVDTHVHRVSQRVGLIGPRATADQAHTLLLELLPHDADRAVEFPPEYAAPRPADLCLGHAALRAMRAAAALRLCAGARPTSDE